jgi:uncharacterized membrane protein
MYLFIYRVFNFSCCIFIIIIIIIQLLLLFTLFNADLKRHKCLSARHVSTADAIIKYIVIIKGTFVLFNSSLP